MVKSAGGGTGETRLAPRVYGRTGEGNGWAARAYLGAASPPPRVDEPTGGFCGDGGQGKSGNTEAQADLTVSGMTRGYRHGSGRCDGRSLEADGKS